VAAVNWKKLSAVVPLLALGNVRQPELLLSFLYHLKAEIQIFCVLSHFRPTNKGEVGEVGGLVL